MIARFRPKRRSEDGAAAVELALVLPILLLLVFGIISFGIIFAQQLAVNNGVRQGVRSAVVAGNITQQTCGQVLSSIQSASGPTIGMSTGDVKVQVQRVPSTGPPFNCFTAATKTATGANINKRVCAEGTGVEASIKATSEYETKLLTGLPFMTSPTFTLTATAVYRCEFSS
ncbi:MAG: pilus assembly protein [Actinomycetia bacterium]|nr:pilus assembly protein [Actinomycetes bacterium]